jgi:hypothetical protein
MQNRINGLLNGENGVLNRKPKFCLYTDVETGLRPVSTI